MNADELAKLLLDSDEAARSSLISAHADSCAQPLIEAFKRLVYEVWTSEPQTVGVIRALASELVAFTGSESLVPHLEWIRAIEHLVNGRLEDSLDSLETSESKFRRSSQIAEAAKTLTSKLYVLALMGRYDEAVESGETARAIFEESGDEYSAGKIEHNLGNLFWRRDLYSESEPYLASASERFRRLGDERQIAMVENSHAFVKALQNDFETSESIYRSALQRAIKSGNDVTTAEIETGLSNLFLFQGRLELALHHMENSRSSFEKLGMPIQIANTELEIADIYFELSLLPEAIEYYEKAVHQFSELGMQAELLRGLLGISRAFLKGGDIREALAKLDETEKIAELEDNRVSGGLISLYRAEIQLVLERHEEALSSAETAAEIFKDAGNLRYELLAEIIASEAQALIGERDVAIDRLRECSARGSSMTQILFLACLAEARISKSETLYRKAIALVENTRSRLGGGDFKVSFLSGRTAPFEELAALLLERGEVRHALEICEQARARSLHESTDGSEVAGEHSERMAVLRKEMTWYHNRLLREESGLGADGQSAAIRKLLASSESEYSELYRRKLSQGKSSAGASNRFDLEGLRNNLDGTQIVEYVRLGNTLGAFVVSANDLCYVHISDDFSSIRSAVERFVFQIKTDRMSVYLSDSAIAAHRNRLEAHSANLYKILIRPLLEHFNSEKLVIVPTDTLYLLPFHALKDEGRHLISDFEVSYFQSAGLFASRDRHFRSPPASVLIVASHDELTPNVEAEACEISGLFEKGKILWGDSATIESIAEFAAEADIVHFACHASFRADRPEYSYLSLGGSRLMLRDLAGMDFGGKLITLSACETGVARYIKGEELTGFSSSFLKMGAAGIVQSLWTADDETTRRLMVGFYQGILAGRNARESLKNVQAGLIGNGCSEYLWAPFEYVGK
ncbi:MAG: CHAT domain-containing protein [Pyrinomonadaceae bacterium]